MSVRNLLVTLGLLPARLAPAAMLALLWIGTGLIAAPLAVAQQQEQKPRPRVAVLEFERIDVPAAEGAALTDRLRTDLVNLGTFTVLDRARTEQVLKELAFQQEGVTDPGQAVRIGKLLNVEFIVTGRVARLPNAYQVNAQIIQVETAEVVRSETLLHRGDIIGLLSENMGTMAVRLAQVEAKKPEPAPPAVTKAEAKPEPETPPTPPPAEEVGRPKWSLWTGGIAVAAGLVLELGAISDSSDAMDMADDARTTRDSNKFNEAEALQSDAESQEVLALVLLGAGVGLLFYYYSQAGAESAVATPPGPPPFQLAVSGKAGVRIGYALRW